MKKIIIGLLLCLCKLTSFSQHQAEQFTFPAEWEKHDAIWMGARGASNRGFLPKNEVLLQIIKVLTPYVKINLIVDYDSTALMLEKEFEKRGIDRSKVQMFVYSAEMHRNVRDPGPIFLKSNKGNLMIADMKWGSYGSNSNTPAAKRIDTIDLFVARNLHLPVRTSNLISEGGDHEFNGKGVMMVVEPTEMSRNKGWSKDSIEKELLRMFGQKKITWLKRGLVEDDPFTKYELPSGTVYVSGPGHIDEFCRFAPNNTILLAEVTKEESLKDTVHKISYERLEENFRILKGATDLDGKPFRILRVPVAEMMTKTDSANSKDTFAIVVYHLPPKRGTYTYYIATGYLNFLVTNGVVLMASYWKPGRPEIIKQKDETAKNVIHKAFPNRKIIQINVEILNQGMGGIHCATQQQPSVN